MVDPVAVLRVGLVIMRLVVFSLTLGITLISFQAYRKRPSERLQYAFMGFAFVSMGVAVSSVITQLGGEGAGELIRIFFGISETIPFIVGFTMLYLSLYR
jgi:hypothetical protein